MISICSLSNILLTSDHNFSVMHFVPGYPLVGHIIHSQRHQEPIIVEGDSFEQTREFTIATHAGLFQGLCSAVLTGFMCRSNSIIEYCFWGVTGGLFHLSSLCHLQKKIMFQKEHEIPKLMIEGSKLNKDMNNLMDEYGLFFDHDGTVCVQPNRDIDIAAFKKDFDPIASRLIIICQEIQESQGEFDPIVLQQESYREDIQRKMFISQAEYLMQGTESKEK